MSETLLAGVDLGGTTITTVIVTGRGEILGQATVPTLASAGPRRVIRQIAHQVLETISKTGLTPTQICVLGVGSPGPLSPHDGVVIVTPNMPGWKDIPIIEWLREEVSIEAFLEDDSVSACWGEFWLGAGSNVNSMIAITLGTGVGGGMIIDNNLWRGATDLAGNVGHMIVDVGGRECGCGNYGCLEQYSSAVAVVRSARDRFISGEESEIIKDFDSVTAKEIASAAEAGCPLCAGVIAEAGQYLGVGIANLVNVVNPEMFVLCGGLAGAGDRFMKAIWTSVKTGLLKTTTIRVERSKLGEVAGAVGAAGLAQQRLLGSQ